MTEWMKMALALGGPVLLCFGLLYLTLKPARDKHVGKPRKLTGRQRTAVAMATAGDRREQNE